MEEIIEEGQIKGSIDIISIDKINLLSEQMKKCICKIDGNKKGTGFFCKINYENKLIPVLMTNYHVINPDYFEKNKNLIISINEQRIVIKINNNNILYSSPKDEYDLMIIKLNESQNQINNYLEIDKHIFSNESEKTYENESIYILHYPSGRQPSISFGYGFKQKNNYNMYHRCNTENCSSGGPILSLSSNKIIGIHRGCIRNKDDELINFATFLKFPLNDLNQDKLYKIISIIENNNDKVNKAKNNNFLVNKNNNLKKDINEKTEVIIKDIKFKYNALIDFFSNIKDQLDYNKIKFLFNKIGNFIMNEEELFNSEKNVQSFMLLEVIQKNLLLNKLDLEKLNKTKYIMNILKFKEIILKIINEGEINFNSYKEIYLNFEKREIFKEKLRIIFFNNNEQVEKNLEILKKYFLEFMKEAPFLQRLNIILKAFYEQSHKNNIEKLEKLRNAIFSGMLNIFRKSEIKKEIDEMNKIISPEELKKKYGLSGSIFFMQLYKKNKYKYMQSKTEEEIFELTETDFNYLKLLFQSENWSKEIPESILNECLRCLRYQKQGALIYELNGLKKIFKIENFDELNLARLKDGLEIIKLYNEIILTTNSYIYFIDELNANKTDFYEEMNKIKNDIPKVNISLDKIENLGNSLLKLGINVIDPKVEERNYLDILQCLYENKKSIELLSKLNEKNISDLSILVDKNIEDVMNCSNFIRDLLKEKGKINDKKLIEKFIKKVSTTKNISQNFNNYSNIAERVEDFFPK